MIGSGSDDSTGKEEVMAVEEGAEDETGKGKIGEE